MNHPDAIALISSIGDIITKPHNNTGLIDKFKVTYSPADSFKNSIEREAVLFTIFKEGKHWYTWHRNTLSTARAQDVVEVLNSNYCAITADDANLFKEKHKCM